MLAFLTPNVNVWKSGDSEDGSNLASNRGKPPGHQRNATWMPPQLTPPRCLTHSCNITCCNKGSNQQLDDPEKWLSHGRPKSEQNVVPKDLRNKTVTDVPYKILPPDKGAYITSTKTWLAEDYQPPPRDAPVLKPDSSRPNRRLHPNYTKLKKSPRLMDQNSENALPIEDSSVTNEIKEDYAPDPNDIDISNEPQIMVMDSDDHRPVRRRKRETDFHNSPATLLFVQINKTIDQVYCVNSNCFHGGNYSYYIPMSPVFPQAFMSISFQMRTMSEAMEVHLCEEAEINVCDEVSSTDEDVKITAVKNYGNMWDLPVGYYFESFFKFRVAKSGQDKIIVCNLSKNVVGQTYSEYNLSFKRICDDVPRSVSCFRQCLKSRMSHVMVIRERHTSKTYSRAKHDTNANMVLGQIE
ncbi:hypothetical protein LSH36_808g00088 [Paralvinella palmiformis]|uniref:Myelin gene regulatory factor C-terminal domain-containing protein n=1 Tax=Paralvinella palmiformis TaxID=53620 RepID=A0AAD9J0S3_9ANNE|nr:hypothetical protein LSH36_808g00088 [Paralvinella palmiformis]